MNELAYVPMPSLIDLSDSDGEGTSWTYDLTALPKLKVLPANDLIKSKYNVVKKWVNDTEGIRPEYVTAVLYRNGVEFDSAVLNDDNNWEHTWSNLPATADWSIKEKEIPFGYEVTYEESENTVTIVNDIKKIRQTALTTAMISLPALQAKVRAMQKNCRRQGCCYGRF